MPQVEGWSQERGNAGVYGESNVQDDQKYTRSLETKQKEHLGLCIALRFHATMKGNQTCVRNTS